MSKKIAIVCNGAESKNLYPTFTTGSSVVATVFACTSMLPML